MIGSKGPSRVWLFLGDSITEGIGQSRDSYVAELVDLLRKISIGSVSYLRLRRINAVVCRDFKAFNLFGFIDAAFDSTGNRLWLVNLAAESTTVEHDLETISLLNDATIDRVFILRGPLESIIRPSSEVVSQFPFWIPPSWRRFAGLDPRCYFSASVWRRAKQQSVDFVKQRVRHLMLRGDVAPMLGDTEFIGAYTVLIAALVKRTKKVSVLSLTPVDGSVFPGTPQLIHERNVLLKQLSARHGVDFIEWSASLNPADRTLFCRDGFHPTKHGSKAMAQQLLAYLDQTGALLAQSASDA